MGEKDIRLLEALSNMEPKQVAEYFEITEGALNAWVARIRQRKERYIWWLEKVRNIEKKHPHIKKRLLPARKRRRTEIKWSTPN